MPGREQPLEHAVFDEAVRLVVTLALLVLDHRALLVEPCLIDHPQQVSHSVAFHPASSERGAGHGLEVVRRSNQVVPFWSVAPTCSKGPK
jgi:hypothetical protein